MKAKLAGGAFERAVREAGFERIVCVGNAVAILPALAELGVPRDGHSMIFELCLGAFEDRAWFARTCSWITDPRNRSAEIPDAGDWWYVDDLAELYAARAGRAAWFRRHAGRRILVPLPSGDGSDVLAWLRSTR